MAQTQTQAATVAGYFEDETQAERAIQELRDAGFTSAHLGVAHRNRTSSSAFTSSNAGHRSPDHDHPGMWDKVKSFFDGSSAEDGSSENSVTSASGGPAAEPYADERSQGDLANREVTETADDGYAYQHTDVHQSLNNLSVPEDRSRYLGHRFGANENGAVVTVNAGNRVTEAEAILKKNGADLGENASGYDYSQNTAPAEGTQNIQLLGEVLRVHKDRVSQGEVRIRKEVITENQTVQVPVTREELVIERHAVNGNAQANGSVGEGSEIRIPLSEERASVDKSTVVREEVSVGKKEVGSVRDLSGDVRHEELIVDDQTKKAVNE